MRSFVGCKIEKNVLQKVMDAWLKCPPSASLTGGTMNANQTKLIEKRHKKPNPRINMSDTESYVQLQVSKQ